MAFGSSSAIFTQAMLNPIAGRVWSTAAPTGYTNLSADTINVALYGNTGTPNKDVTAANSCYAVDQWVTGNEVTDSTNWQAGGRALGSKTWTIPTTSYVMFDGADTSGNGNVTITAAYGCLVYENSISSPSKQGLCYNAFGSSQSVGGGSFTVVWDSTGVFKISV